MALRVLLIVAAVILMSVAGWGAYAQKSRRPSTAWEYKRVQILSDDAALRELGAQGWELVAIDNNSTAVSIYVFKRAR